MKKKSKSFLFTILTGVLVGIFLLFTEFQMESISLWTTVLLFLTHILGWFLGMFLGILIHEGGHALFGALSGMRFQLFELFGLRYDGSSWRFLHDRAGKQGLMGGVSMAATPYVTHSGYRNFLMGGVIGNFFLALVTLLLTILTKGYLRAFFAGIFAINVYLGVSNLMAHPRDRLYTDGDLIRLSVDKQSGFFDVVHTESLIYSGKSPKELPPIPVDSSDILVRTQQAMLRFLQNAELGKWADNEKLMDLIHPLKNPLMNINDEERFGYVLLQGWVNMEEEEPEYAQSSSNMPIIQLVQMLKGKEEKDYTKILEAEENPGMVKWLRNVINQTERMRR